MPLIPNTVSFTSGLSDFDAEQRTIEQNRRLAEQLRQEAAQQIAPGTTVPGGYFVATNPLQHLAHALKGVNARLYRERADEQARTLGDRRSQALVEALKGMPMASTVTEKTDQEGTGSFDMSGTAGPAMATVKPTMADNAAWLGRLSAVGPQALQIGSTVLGMQQKADEADENRAFRTTEAAANRAARLQERQMQIDFQLQNAQLSREQTAMLTRERMENARQLAQMQIESRLDLARFAAANRADAAANKPPPGYRFTAGGDLQAIPGGPADMKQQGAYNADNAMLTNAAGSMDRLATAANEVMTHKGLGGITGLRGVIPNIPGGAAADAAAKLQTLKAQVGFGVLQEMRNASKTGGALGAVTEKELTFLQNALSALDQAQSVDQMKESLQKIIDYTEGAKGRLRGAFNMKHQSRDSTDDPLGLRR